MAYGFSGVLEAAAGALDRAPTARSSSRAARQARRRFSDKLAGTVRALWLRPDCNWSQFDLGWMYTFFFVLLGLSAATWGGWLERAGPRKAGVVSAICWCGGLLISALGVIHPPAVADVARLGASSAASGSASATSRRSRR